MNKQITYIYPSPFNFWTLRNKFNNLSKENGMDVSCWNNSCSTLFNVDITHEFTKSLIRVDHLSTVFLLYIAEDNQLIISYSICVSRNTHTHTHESELFLEGKNYPWRDMDQCKYSNYFCSACGGTVGLKRALNKLLFCILVAVCPKVTSRSEVDINPINKVSKYSKWIRLQSKWWGTIYYIKITLYRVLSKKKKKKKSSDLDYLI